MAAVREQNRVATRQRILDAVHEVLTEDSPATLSMPRVAERSGVSLRTLYRYFPTKEALVSEAAGSFSQDGMAAVGGPPTRANLADYLRASWTGFARELPAVRAQHLAPAGRELRARRLPSARRLIRTALEAEGGGLSDEDLDRLTDLIVALTSSTMFLELVDRLGWTPEDAASLAVWTTESIIDRAHNEGAVAP